VLIDLTTVLTPAFTKHARLAQIRACTRTGAATGGSTSSSATRVTNLEYAVASDRSDLVSSVGEVRGVPVVVVGPCGDTSATRPPRGPFEQQRGRRRRFKIVSESAAQRTTRRISARGSRCSSFQTSIAARRAVRGTWSVACSAADATREPNAESAVRAPGVAHWFTHDDFDRVFKHLYEGLGPAGRKARANAGRADDRCGLRLEQDRLDALEHGLASAALRPITSQRSIADKAQGIAGANRVGYSPGAMRQLIHSYREQDACRTAPVPDCVRAGCDEAGCAGDRRRACRLGAMRLPGARSLSRRCERDVEVTMTGTAMPICTCVRARRPMTRV